MTAKSKAFVLYRKPNGKVITFLRLGEPADKISAPSFVVKAFAGEGPTVYPILEKEEFEDALDLGVGTMQNASYDHTLNDASYDYIRPQDNTSRLEYMKIVEKAVKAIQGGDLLKVVLARTEFFEMDPPSMHNLFDNLLLDSHAFVYIFGNGEGEFWAGASPEYLLKLSDGMVSSMALAGTRLISSSADWAKKEQDEQKVVGDYIVNRFKLIGAQSVSQSRPFTISTGHIQHICSEVRGEISSSIDLSEIIQALHPTPALGGFPKDEAINFIAENETFDRRLYGGYLGEISPSSAELYVNIRCIQLGANGVQLYSGAGINDGSEASNEWNETENKLGIMKEVLDL